jgi:hypothetical protein
MIVQFPIPALIDGHAKISVQSPYIGRRCRVKLLSYSFALAGGFVPALYRWDFTGFRLETAAIIDGTYANCSHGLIVPAPDSRAVTCVIGADAYVWEGILGGPLLSAELTTAVTEPGLLDPAAAITNSFVYGHIAVDITPLE